MFVYTTPILLQLVIQHRTRLSLGLRVICFVCLFVLTWNINRFKSNQALPSQDTWNCWPLLRLCMYVKPYIPISSKIKLNFHIKTYWVWLKTWINLSNVVWSELKSRSSKSRPISTNWQVWIQDNQISSQHCDVPCWPVYISTCFH